MTTTETGWTKEFPQVEGFYFARRTQTNAPALTVIEVWQYEDEWFAYRFANQDDIEAKDFIRSLYEYLGPLSPSDFEQLIRLRKEVVDLRIDQQAVRELYELPHEGDFYEQMADHLEYDTVDKVRLQNAVWNLLTETFYEDGLKNNGVAVKFLMRLHLLACEAGLPEYTKNNPVVAEALAALGDPAENSPESLAAAHERREALAHREGEKS